MHPSDDSVSEARDSNEAVEEPVPEAMHIDARHAQSVTVLAPWDHGDDDDESQLIAQAQWLHDTTVPQGHSWNYSGDNEDAPGPYASGEPLVPAASEPSPSQRGTQEAALAYCPRDAGCLGRHCKRASSSTRR